MDEDMVNQVCLRCSRGVYEETSLQDDWDGVLHCSECGHEIARWQDSKEIGR